MDASFQSIPLTQLKESPWNARKVFDKQQLEELTASVREKGILNPLLVRGNGTGYEILAGARRYRAAKAAGLEAAPAIVRELDDQAALEVMIVDNLQRADLHPLEEAEGYRQLLATSKPKHDVAWIAERVGRSHHYVYDSLKLLSLTKEAQELFREGTIQKAHAVLLARLSPADQKRAIGNEDHSPLFTNEQLLLRPDDEGDEVLEPRKAISARELQAWIDQHVKLEAAEADPMLFPNAVATIKAAADHKEKVVRITYDDITPDALREAPGPRPILGRSWKRADGKAGSHTCDRSVIGHVVIGPARGEAFRVCVDKKGCTVHWKELQNAAKRREREVSKSASTGEDREALRRKKQQEEEARRKAEREAFERARPKVVEALAAALKKAPAGAGSPLGELVLDGCEDGIYIHQHKDLTRYMPPGKSAEDLVRHIGMAILLGDVDEYGRYQDSDRLFKDAKAFGVDVKKLIAAAAPAPEPKPATTKKAAKKKR